MLEHEWLDIPKLENKIVFVDSAIPASYDITARDQDDIAILQWTSSS